MEPTAQKHLVSLHQTSFTYMFC